MRMFVRIYVGVLLIPWNNIWTLRGRGRWQKLVVNNALQKIMSDLSADLYQFVVYAIWKVILTLNRLLHIPYVHFMVLLNFSKSELPFKLKFDSKSYILAIFNLIINAKIWMDR